MAFNRVPLTSVPLANYVDGQIIFGADVNTIISVFKAAVNANGGDLSTMLSGDRDANVAVSAAALDLIESPADGDLAFVLNDETQSNVTSLYSYNNATSTWDFVYTLSVSGMKAQLEQILDGTTAQTVGWASGTRTSGGLNEKTALQIATTVGANPQNTSIGATGVSFSDLTVDDLILRSSTGHTTKIEYDDDNNKISLIGEVTGAETFQFDINQDLKTTASPTFNEVVATSLRIDGKDIDWNNSEGTFDFVLNGSTLQLGQELHFYGKAVGTIAKGDVVMFADQQGNHITFTKATGAGLQAFPQAIMGVANTTIANGQFGHVSWFGRVRDLANTSGETWETGDILYADVSTGQLTKVVPTAPDKIIQVAAVITVQNANQQTGIKILVRPHFIETALLNAQGVVDDQYLKDELIKGVTFDSVNNRIQVTNNAGTVSNLDISKYLDDTNLAKIEGGTFDSETGIATFTRDDDSAFTLDLSSLFDDTDTNTFVNAASFESDTITLTRNDAQEITISLANTYEPLIGAKLTAFNKNFTVSGGNNGDNGDSVDVARGNHSHSEYLTVGDIEILPDTVTLQEWADVEAHIEIDGSDELTANPHGVTKAQIGLSNVDNTSDANKPVSSATQTALNNKPDSLAELDDVDLTTTAPTEGQTLIYDDVIDKWVPGDGGSSVTISATAPVDPGVGDLWFDSTTASLYLYYDDGSSTQWVEVTYQQDYAEVANYSTTIAAADTWTDQTGYFTLAKTVTGIVDTDKPIADLNLSAATVSDVADIQAAWATIYRVVTTANTVTFYALEDPTFPEDAVIDLQVVR